MAATKLSLSFDEELAHTTRAVAREQGRSLSLLAAELTADGLRRRALPEAITVHETEAGAISDMQMAQVRASVASTRHGARH